MPKVRPDKVNSVLQRLISEYILREGFEGITGFVTITGVDTVPDLEHAKVYFSVVGQDEEKVLEILRANIYDIQGALYENLEMKRVPRINFVPDRSGEYADKIGKLIKKVKDGDQTS